MALFLFLILLFIAPFSNAQGPLSPGYWPSSKFRSMSFYKGFRNLWGPQHQRLGQNALTIWLDSTSGSGFKSVRPFRSGYFGASIKLQPGYTAGVITAFYLSNSEAHPGFHDEVDMEFLGTTFGKPYTLQTNVYIRGSGDGKIIGREMKFHLWFDPTKAFHHYAILWSPKELIFFVDDVPIRRYPRRKCYNISSEANVALWFNMGCFIMGH
ncbi:Xyloglucan endotransglucosylase/hydrolase [Quillaja saponaria]|uniref:Xyloglucan endotransglucosylase/hydrolase n=1 Tax=Quillaja saponaria TaxID=32244 RepID=A0AAD7Q088_QUISA|nr:Xyloglucan endotransglucosylase/hydrolase [Quillaja saponaria]